VREFERCLIAGTIALLFAEAAHAKGNPHDTPNQGAAPKNIILLIGDGMGPAQVGSARLLDPDGSLVLDELDADPGFMTTDDVDGGITDSAAAATAMATGQKTYYGAVSVDVDGNLLETALERAEANGKATGILSSVFLADATPGVWAAHAIDRGMYTEIAIQESESGVEVLLGSGELNFLPTGANGTGSRNLVEEMVANGYELVRSVDELMSAQAREDKLLGFWGGYTMTYALDRHHDVGLDEPTLAQMTEKAIEVLGRDADGFFLMVEGGAIDWTAHDRDIAGTVAETLAFDDAVAVALDFAAASGDTLVIATADHETGGLRLGSRVNTSFIANVSATTSFMWGQIKSGALGIDAALARYAGIGTTWPRLTRQEKALIEANGEMGIADVLSARAGVSWGWSGLDDGEHTRTKVPVYAFGPGSERLNGTRLDNTDIGKLLLEAVRNN
jgi:alkaline phosphatase